MDTEQISRNIFQCQQVIRLAVTVGLCRPPNLSKDIASCMFSNSHWRGHRQSFPEFIMLSSYGLTAMRHAHGDLQSPRFAQNQQSCLIVWTNWPHCPIVEKHFGEACNAQGQCLQLLAVNAYGEGVALLLSFHLKLVCQCVKQ